MVFVRRIGHRFEEGGIAGRTADIFGRARPLACCHARIPRVGLCLKERLEEHFVLPAIAEVILMDQARLEGGEQIPDTGLTLAHHR